MSNVYDPRLRELETLKAQLAKVSEQRDQYATFRRNEEVARKASEAQVRELRERERFAVQLLRQILYPSPDDITDGQSIRLAAEKLIMENHQRNAAALRSAPPSGSQSDKTTKLAKQYCYEPFPMHLSDKIYFCDLAKGHDGMHRSASLGLKWPRNDAWDRAQAPFDKTDAWEERQDLARQSSDASQVRKANSCAMPVHAGGASEQVPAAPDGFTGSREVREDVRGTSTADKSVEYSEPQDSPSLPQAAPLITIAQSDGMISRDFPGVFCPYCERAIEIDATSPASVLGIHYRPLTAAPPSPAREKEKAE